jgi:hypothetical protein
MVIVKFPSEMMVIAASYEENVDEDSMGLTNTSIKGEVWRKPTKVKQRRCKALRRLL